MKIIKPSFEVMTPLTNARVTEMLKLLETVARTCYQSEGKITETSYIPLLKKLIERGHEAMLEHASITVRFICDRGVSHELVRHRIASFAQESTRYCNYGKSGEITFIEPFFFFYDDGREDSNTIIAKQNWYRTMQECATTYLNLLEAGAKPEEARTVLPNSLKTSVVVTMNLRELRHFLKLRTAKEAHPQMREITRPLLSHLQINIPVIFDDIVWVDEK